MRTFLNINCRALSSAAAGSSAGAAAGSCSGSWAGWRGTKLSTGTLSLRATETI